MSEFSVGRMRAIQIDRHGGPDVLQVRNVAEPAVPPGHVLVRTVASSLNPVDWKTRAWDRGPAFPMTLGWDLAGIVVAGPGFSPGDRVVAMSGQISTGLGTWADLVAVPASLLAPAPTRVSLVEAAALPLAGSTALQALQAIGPLAGQQLLVTGAVGGVGALAVQLARRAGARVDALVSRPEHIEAAAELGAEQVAYRLADLDRLYDAVFDTGSVDPGVLLRAGGRYASITDDPLPNIPGAINPQVREDGAGLAELVKLVDAGELRLRVAHYYPMGEVRRAHEEFEAGGLLGKIILLF